MDLFEHRHQQLSESEAPLAARMRPRSLDEFVGQDAIIGPGRLLRRAIQADQLSSLIFYGPPGTGKTTLARVIANTTMAQFVAINAVLGGVKDIRAAIEQAQTHRGQFGRRTILFVDEVHRFNKAQQDALLPWVENGTVILIGATTENPFFEVNKALVSRSRVFQLKPLNADDLRAIVQQALNAPKRGYGEQNIQIDTDALEHLVNVANGDARTVLNALELAVETTSADSDKAIRITLPVAEDSIQQRAVLYDKEGDAHFDIISAFIKSVRGSDPDAALYWLARMVYAGEDPRYIFRRLVILAGEDVGMADPNAVVVVTGCAAAFDRVGMPEGRYPLAQATLYLATAPKSNSAMAFFDALAAVEAEREGDVPNAMRDATRDKKGFGHGAGYLYPHAYRDHWVAQQYLPGSLQGQVFYQPSDQGYEAQIQTQVARRREAQLAALVEQNNERSMPEALTYGPLDQQQDRWLQRATGVLGEQLGEVRDRIFTRLNPQRHHVLLDLNASTGLLTWEAVRQVPEGGVYSCVHTAKAYSALTEQSEMLGELSRPRVIQLQNFDWLEAIKKEQSAEIIFDGIVGRNALIAIGDKHAAIKQFSQLLCPNGIIVLVESIPSRAQRLSDLLIKSELEPALYAQLLSAESYLFNNPDDPMVNWNVTDLQCYFEQSNFNCEIEVSNFKTEVLITSALLKRWLGEGGKYCNRLTAQGVSSSDLVHLRNYFSSHFDNKNVSWARDIAFIEAKHA
ncbi:AAA family ATPase [cf. Phormidesmis sp. LEGE 11477]|uniref:AAA family ATPase n=1 Tax=cf. Phormidesmis sp. LEGE 11477 TaxID=1828680 RepID=UPI001881A62B|nr:AAA family ATPase [cf. Phormidesmis sp. LEGE 11477]MBE9060914.1 AAA family ATPase [cf. Phormidesmis sp. LEGE 11477]